MAEWIVEIVDGIPHIKNMIPLVRCKDCKYFKVEQSEIMPNVEACYRLKALSILEEDKLPMITSGDGYCFFGERKVAE